MKSVVNARNSFANNRLNSLNNQNVAPGANLAVGGPTLGAPAPFQFDRTFIKISYGGHIFYFKNVCFLLSFYFTFFFFGF